MFGSLISILKQPQLIEFYFKMSPLYRLEHDIFEACYAADRSNGKTLNQAVNYGRTRNYVDFIALNRKRTINTLFISGKTDKAHF